MDKNKSSNESYNIAQTMKRSLSIDLQDTFIEQQQQQNKKQAKEKPNMEAKLDNDYVTSKPTQAIANNLNDSNDEVIILSQESVEPSTSQTFNRRRAAKKIPDITTTENYLKLKELFPNVHDDNLVIALQRFKNKKNMLDFATDFLISTATEEKVNEEKQQLLNKEEKKPHLFKYVDFIQNLFPDIGEETSLQVISAIEKDFKFDENNNSNNSTKEQAIVEYILEKQLNNDETKRNNEEIANKTQPSTSKESELDNDFEKITVVIKDCDPNHIKSKLEALKNDHNRVQLIISELLEKPNYPKLKDYLKKVKKEEQIEKLLNNPMNFEEFLKLYPDPLSHFYNLNNKLSENYKAHVRIELMNKFWYIAEETLNEILVEKKYHLTPTYRCLQEIVGSKEDSLKQKANSNRESFIQKYKIDLNVPYAMERMAHLPKAKFTRKGKTYKLSNLKRTNQQYPDELDERFFHELQFIRFENPLKTFIANKEQTRRIKFEEAKRLDSLCTCNCCFNDELLTEEMLSCPDGHFFCKDCIKKYVETSIGDYKYKFDCIDENCKLEFDMSTLNLVLEPNAFANVQKNIQNEEIRKANIQDLESCPHCPYAAIIENKNEKVFYCQNSSCLKETCRLCNEPNHLPLRCNEVEKKNEVNMRTWIENKITEAMIRICHKCGKRFYKTEGCNMMHCVCGAAMCYVCREPITSYQHFSNPEGCKQFTDVNELHKSEMEKAYKEAIENYKTDHPESIELIKNMKYDPKKIIDELKASQKPNPPTAVQPNLILPRPPNQIPPRQPNLAPPVPMTDIQRQMLQQQQQQLVARLRVLEMQQQQLEQQQQQQQQHQQRLLQRQQELQQNATVANLQNKQRK